jgi:hypothetical protein
MEVRWLFSHHLTLGYVMVFAGTVMSMQEERKLGYYWANVRVVDAFNKPQMMVVPLHELEGVE